ncbi:MAG: Abi family protein [Candidatus Symbiobacter sp.]|nr:Abi family protein [Candidatus Symbiobacter sp.]
MIGHKKFRTYEEQAEILIQRGLIIENRERFNKILENFGNYRLGLYWHPFRDNVTKQFYENTSFSTVEALVRFDEALARVIFSAVREIEIYFRSAISYELAKKGPEAYLSQDCFHQNASRLKKDSIITQHQSWLIGLNKNLARSKEEFIEHHREKYKGHFPIWVVFQVMEFGLLAETYSIMTWQDKTAISHKFNLSHELLESWLISLNNLRNVAAHHGRIWNKNLAKSPSFPKRGEITCFEPLLDFIGRDQWKRKKIYGLLCIIAYLLNYINPNGDWREVTARLLQQFPKSQYLKLDDMGTPNNWQSHGFWRHLPP